MYVFQLSQYNNIRLKVYYVYPLISLIKFDNVKIAHWRFFVPNPCKGGNGKHKFVSSTYKLHSNHYKCTIFSKKRDWVKYY